MVIVKGNPPGANAVPAGQGESRRHGLVGIFLIGHDHQDVGFLVHHSSSSLVCIPVLRGLDCVLIASWRVASSGFRIMIASTITSVGISLKIINFFDRASFFDFVSEG
jgi:hypothetical protein